MNKVLKEERNELCGCLKEEPPKQRSHVRACSKCWKNGKGQVGQSGGSEDSRGGDEDREAAVGGDLWITGRALAFTLSEAGAMEGMEQRRGRS